MYQIKELFCIACFCTFTGSGFISPYGSNFYNTNPDQRIRICITEKYNMQLLRKIPVADFDLSGREVKTLFS